MRSAWKKLSSASMAATCTRSSAIGDEGGHRLGRRGVGGLAQSSDGRQSRLGARMAEIANHVLPLRGGLGGRARPPDRAWLPGE